MYQHTAKYLWRRRPECVSCKPLQPRKSNALQTRWLSYHNQCKTLAFRSKLSSIEHESKDTTRSNIFYIPFLTRRITNTGFNFHITNFTTIRTNITSSPAYDVFISLQIVKKLQSFSLGHARDYPLNYSLGDAWCMESVTTTTHHYEYQ